MRSFVFLCAALSAMPAAAAPPVYPVARREPLIEKLHGTDVADPYRWMEDIDSTETRTWVEAQAKLTSQYLEGIPQRTSLLNRLKELQNYDKHGMPVLIGGRLFYSRKTGLQAQGILYWREDKPDAPEQVLLDPNTLSKDGTVALGRWDVTDDGKLLAYSINEAGSDWTTIHVREVATAKDLPDVIRWVKFSAASWSRDGKGFYYGRFAEPKPGQELKAKNLNQELYFHRIGEPQDKDTLIYARPDKPEWSFYGGETEDGRYLVISVGQGTREENAVFYRDLSKGPESPIVELFKDWDAEWNVCATEGSVFYFLTTHKAPNRRVVAVDLADPAPEHWREILPEGKSVLTRVSYADGKFIAQRLVDAHDELMVHDKSGKALGAISVPNFGSAGISVAKQSDTQFFYAVTGFDTPGSIYRHDLTTGKSALHIESKVPGFSASDIAVEQIFYPSKDGTKIPLFLVHKKNAVKNGANPVILYGYGGFNADMSPSFSPSRLAWLEQGGIWAQACLRGGGEYGKTWHEAGMKEKKQNVFDDFIAAGEWLVAEKWTSPARLAIKGGSNGGLLVAACLNQRPDLFGCALPAVGVHDMLRFQKFTIGWAWQEEYGSPDKAEDFAVLRNYSPYHNVIPSGKYPAVMITTGDHDDRVYPAHSFKYAAAMQYAQAGAAPILLRVDIRAGHGAGKPTLKALEETADEFAFTLQALGVKAP